MKVEGHMGEIFRNFDSIDMYGIVAILVVGSLAVALVRRIMPRLTERLPATYRHAALALTTVLRLAIYLAMVWGIVPLVLRPSHSSVLAVLGASALAIGLGFKEYASSVLAGFVAMFEGTYRLGDRVQIGETYGEVRRIHLRSVKIVTPDDTAVYVPHDHLWNTPVYNANDGARTMLCVAKFYLHPAHDAVLVRQKLIDIALTSPYVDLDHGIVVRAAEEPWGTQYKLKAYARDNRDEMVFITDMTLRAKAAFARLGVKPSAVPAISGAH